MNFKKFLAVLLSVILTLSTVGVLATEAVELPTAYCVSNELTGDALTVQAVTQNNATPFELKLDLGMHFETTELDADAQAKPYYNYVADFELAFDKDVTVTLAGKHRWFGANWLSLGELDFTANETVKIMSNLDPHFTYDEVINLGTFDCGVKFDIDTPAGVKATLNLVMYETEEVTSADEYDFVKDGKYIHITDNKHIITGKEFTYDFALPEAVAEEITGDNLTVQAIPAYNYEAKEAEELTLDFGMHFETTETSGEASEKPYYKYITDFELTFDHDVTALLAGKHRWFEAYAGAGKWLAINQSAATEIENKNGDKFMADIDGIDFKENVPVSIMSFIDTEYNYKDVASLGEFDCGVKLAYDAPSRVEAKLELVMYTTEVVESDAEYDFEKYGKYFKVDRSAKGRNVIASKTFVYDNPSHEISKDATPAEKAEALNGDVENITTKADAVGAIDLVESLEPAAKEVVSPEAIKTIYESYNETILPEEVVAAAVYSIESGVTVAVDTPDNVADVFEEGAIVFEVTATDDESGANVETLNFPALVAIPVENAADVKKVLHLHGEEIEELDFTPKTEGAKTIFVQMSKFSQIAVVENVYDVTVNPTENGTATVNMTEAAKGQVITVTATPAEDYSLNTITVTDASGNPVAVTDNKFTMPADDVTVNVTFKSNQTYRPSTSVGGTGSTTPVKVTVKFETNGGSEIEDVKVEKGEAVEAPKAPEKENNIFIGWFADKELTKEFDFDTEIKKATTIYAGWVEITAENSIVLVIDEKTATVFGEEIENDVAPLIVNERTMLPARFVAESLGANVEWDEENQKVTITKDEKVIEIFIGKDYAMVDGKEVELDSAAFIENSRTYTPVRFISENLGAHVDWDDETKTVTIVKVK